MGRGSAEIRRTMHDCGLDTVNCLALRGTDPPLYLAEPRGRLDPIFTSDEAHAEIFIRDIDAQEMRRRVEWLTGHEFELVRRPTLPVPERVRFRDGRVLDVSLDALAFSQAVSVLDDDGEVEP